MNHESPGTMVEWMLRPRGKKPLSLIRRYRAAIRQTEQFVEGDTVRGKQFWLRVLRILTRNRLGTKCGHGHVITMDNLLVTTNATGVILKCAACDAKRPSRLQPEKRRYQRHGYSKEWYAKNREKSLERSRAYYQRNRERLLAKAKDRQRNKSTLLRRQEHGDAR